MQELIVSRWELTLVQLSERLPLPHSHEKQTDVNWNRIERSWSNLKGCRCLKCKVPLRLKEVFGEVCRYPQGDQRPLLERNRYTKEWSITRKCKTK